MKRIEKSLDFKGSEFSGSEFSGSEVWVFGVWVFVTPFIFIPTKTNHLNAACQTYGLFSKGFWQLLIECPKRTHVYNTEQ